MSNTETEVTIEDRYNELRSIIDDLTSQHDALTQQLQEYSDAAGDLFTVADEVVAEGHAGEIFTEVLMEVEELQSEIDRIIQELPLVMMPAIAAQATGE